MVIVITGPTCVGKTKLSIELAKRINGEVINADSTQIYKDNDVATAKVTLSEMEGIPHHLFSIKELDEEYSVYDYQKDARNCIDLILSKGKVPILVGGTGLYIKACLYNYEFNEENNNLKEMDGTTEELYNKLLEVDPNTMIDKNNRQRIIRALNYYNEFHKSMSDKEKNDTLLYDTLFIGLTTDRSVLYNRINNRVDKMIENGLLDEAKRIYNSNIRSKGVMTPIGYKELFPYFENKKTLEECLDEIKRNSRRYAKRQYTWFNHQIPIKWFDADFSNFNNTIDEVIEEVKKYV